MEMLVNLGIASKLDHPADIVDIIDQVDLLSKRERAVLPERHQLDLTDHAVFDIASSLLALLPEHSNFNHPYVDLDRDVV